MKTILFSHSDLDGIGAIIVGKLYKDKIGIDSFLSMDYGFEEKEETLSELLMYDRIIITDLSPSEGFFSTLIEHGKEVIAFDHHETSAYMSKHEGCVYDKTRCGTRIFWEDYVKPNFARRYPDILADFVRLVDTYDCWREDSPLWEEAVSLNSVIYAMRDYSIRNDELRSQNAFIEFTIKKITLSGMDEWYWTSREQLLIETGKRKENEQYENALSKMQVRIDNKDRTFGLIMIPSKISLVCSRILRENPAMDYIVCINCYGGVTGKLSFRTKERFNLNEIGIAHGHPSSAGGMVTPEMAQELWNKQILVPAYKDSPEFKEDVSSTWFEMTEHVPF